MKTNSDEEALEESDDLDEGQEVDYMTDTDRYGKIHLFVLISNTVSFSSIVFRSDYAWPDKLFHQFIMCSL